MLSGVKYLFNHGAKDIEVQRIVTNELDRLVALMNGDSWPKWAQKQMRLTLERDARREVDQRQTADLLFVGFGFTGSLIAVELVLRLLGT